MRNLTVNQVIEHEAYNPVTYDNDIALLFLDEPVDLTAFTPVCIAQVGNSLVIAI